MYRRPIPWSGQPNHVTPLAQEFSRAAVWLPGITLSRVGSKEYLTWPNAQVAKVLWGGNTGISSSHATQIPPQFKSATKGTFLLVYRPSYYWGTQAASFEVLYGYSAKSCGLEFYAGQMCYKHGSNRYNLTAISGDMTNSLMVLAAAYDGTNHRSAWSAGEDSTKQSGFTVVSGSEYLNNIVWANNNNDVISLNATYNSGSAAEVGGNLFLLMFLPGVALPDSRLASLRDNPWQIFAPRTRRTGLSAAVAAASSASSVTSDFADSYAIRAAVSQDFADSYAIRAAVAAELADSYGVLSAVATNLADAYSINAAVNADLSDSYLLRVTVARDLADSYSVRAAVASNLADSYDIANAGVVVSDLADAYLIRATIASDMTDSAAIRAVVMAEIEDAYAIRAAASNDLADGYTVINAVSADLIDAHAIRAAVAADLLDAYSVFSGSGTGATVEEIVATILAAAQATPLHVDVRAVKGQSIVGSGTEADPWGP